MSTERINVGDRIRFRRGSSDAAVGSVAVNEGLARLINKQNLGTVGANVSAIEMGNGASQFTRLEFRDTPITAGISVNLGVGIPIYTFPAGDLVVTRSTIFMSMKPSTGSPAAATPEMGLGTLIASGAITTLGAGNAAMENISAGATTTTLTNVNDTKRLFAHVIGLNVLSADSHIVHLNFAGAWGAQPTTAMLLNGTVVLEWNYMS